MTTPHPRHHFSWNFRGRESLPPLARFGCPSPTQKSHVPTCGGHIDLCTKLQFGKCGGVHDCVVKRERSRAISPLKLATFSFVSGGLDRRKLVFAQTRLGLSIRG